MNRLTKNFVNLTLFFVLFLIVVTSSIFKIDTIHCSLNKKNCSASLYQKLEVIKNKSIFTINLKNELSSESFNSESILLESYYKKFPGTIILNFNEENVLYKIVLDDNEYFVSESGKILQSNQGVDKLTTIYWFKKSSRILENNSLIQSNHNRIKGIISSINKDIYEVRTIDWLSDEEIIIRIKDQPDIIVDLESIDNKIDSLELLLSSKEINDFSYPVKEIDFRFNLPVLRTRE